MQMRPIHARQSGGVTLALPPDTRLPCDRCAGRLLGICAPLDNEGLSSLVAMGGQRRWEKRQWLFHSDDPAVAVFKITKGVVIEYSGLADGRRQVVAIRSVGDLVGHPARHGRYTLTAQAITPVEACMFGTRMFQAKLERSTEFARAVTDDVSKRLKQACAGLIVVGQLVAIERVAHFILQMEELQWAHGGEMSPIALHLARHEIGDYLGLTLETISRTFAALKDQGLLALVGRDAVSVLDRKRLLQLAKLAPAG